MPPSVTAPSGAIFATPRSAARHRKTPVDHHADLRERGQLGVMDTLSRP
ncbi:hypothetical protein ACFVT2_10785 [Streptomyces sp. NPDC058000]